VIWLSSFQADQKSRSPEKSSPRFCS